MDKVDVEIEKKNEINHHIGSMYSIYKLTHNEIEY